MTEIAPKRPKQPSQFPDVNSRQLRAVMAIAEYRSFIAAAAYLKTSQPALTVTIKKLEKTLGLPLFLRSTRQVTVTAAGREFIAMAERIINDMKLSIRSLRELADQRRGQIIVSSLIPVAITGLIAEYSRRFPNIEIQLREGYQDDIMEDVRSGLADFGVGYLGDLPGTYLTESLGMQALGVVLRGDHPLAKKKEIEFGALKDVPLVSLPAGSGTRHLIDGAAAAAGFGLHHAVTVKLPRSLLGLVRNKVGVAIVPVGATQSPLMRPHLVARPLVRPRLSHEVGIIRLRDRELTPAADGLLVLARDWLHTSSVKPTSE